MVLGSAILTGMDYIDTTSDMLVGLDFGNFIFSTISALIIGFIVALFYSINSKYTKSFFITLSTMPAIVAVIIIMVNGNLGTGVAVAGAFSLVRFRSVAGTAKEIGAIFLAMGAGLAVGMGYILYAMMFVVLISGANYLLSLSKFGEANPNERMLTVTIPEDLDYIDVFDDLIAKYTNECELISVKTSNMGSLFKLKYEVILKDIKQEKNFIDEIRCRNGNLEIAVAKKYNSGNEL